MSETVIKKPQMTPLRKHTLDTYGEMDERELLLELLYAQQVKINKLERIRSNTSLLVWFLIVIPIICAVIFGVMLGSAL